MVDVFFPILLCGCVHVAPPPAPEEGLAVVLREAQPTVLLGQPRLVQVQQLAVCSRQLAVPFWTTAECMCTGTAFSPCACSVWQQLMREAVAVGGAEGGAEGGTRSGKSKQKSKKGNKVIPPHLNTRVWLSQPASATKCMPPLSPPPALGHWARQMPAAAGGRGTCSW